MFQQRRRAKKHRVLTEFEKLQLAFRRRYFSRFGFPPRTEYSVEEMESFLQERSHG